MYNYDPATISPCELPIHRRVNYHSKCGERFWNIKSAKDYCLALCGLPDTSQVDLTHEEWEAVAAVANGGIWPVPNHPYTNENWHDDKSFSAVPGQEVTKEIYEDMLGVLPPATSALLHNGSTVALSLRNMSDLTKDAQQELLPQT